MNDPFEVLIPAVILALPDSISERRRILEAAVAVLPERHQLRRPTRDLLFALNRHECDQREFPFTSGTNPKAK